MQTPARDTVASEQRADFQVLLHAISSCSSVAVKQLLNLDPTLVHGKGWYGQTPLHRACLTGDIEMVKILLDYGSDPNALNDFDETPVHFASKRGIPTMVHVLYQRGGKLDCLDKKGRSPVHDAAQTGSVYMLQYYAERGFNFRTLDENQQSPLHHACSFGHLEAFKFLLKNGRSDPSLKDSDGNTPLHICAREGYSHGSWCLINYLGLGSLHVLNKDGYTPLDLCRQHDRESNRVMVPGLESLYKLPVTAEIKGPLFDWYYHLLMPFVSYAITVLLTLSLFTRTQGIWFVLVLAYIIRSSRKASHRLSHCSRWPSPLFAGLFAAGMFHTMLVYYCHVLYFISDYKLLALVSVLLNIAQLYLYRKLLVADPGVVTTGEINKKTGKPTTLTDLCEPGGSLDRYCFTCEITQGAETKHCKLCNRCYYKMDHHCLFLLKCIGYNNHARFVWFIIFTLCIMVIFLLEVIFIYIPTVHVYATYKEMLLNLFWEDAWVLSMALLHVGSIVWAGILLQFQLKIISKGQTTFFQASTSTLTPMERVLNAIYFLQGKPLYAVDFMFEDPKKNCCGHKSLDSRHVHDV